MVYSCSDSQPAVPRLCEAPRAIKEAFTMTMEKTIKPVPVGGTLTLYEVLDYRLNWALSDKEDYQPVSKFEATRETDKTWLTADGRRLLKSGLGRSVFYTSQEAWTNVADRLTAKITDAEEKIIEYSKAFNFAKWQATRSIDT